MANTNAPFGFRPFGGSAAGAFTPSNSHIWRKAVYNATAMYRGDVVKADGSGYVVVGTNGAGIVPQGIFWGCEYLSVSQGRRIWSTYWPGSDVASGQTVDVELIPISGSLAPLFIVQMNSTNATFAEIDLNCDFVATAGSVVGGYGKSAMTLTLAGAGSTQTLPFRIRGLYSQYVAANTPGTDDTSNYNIVVVSANTNYELGQ
jgi:hypothetical protein